METPDYYTRIEDIPSDPEFAVSSRQGQRIVRTPTEIGDGNMPLLEQTVGRQLLQEDVREIVLDLRDSLQVSADIVDFLLGALEQASRTQKEIILGGPLAPEVEFLLDLEPLKDRVRVVNLYETNALG